MNLPDNLRVFVCFRAPGKIFTDFLGYLPRLWLICPQIVGNHISSNTELIRDKSEIRSASCEVKIILKLWTDKFRGNSSTRQTYGLTFV
jgi:hypothetical protein